MFSIKLFSLALCAALICFANPASAVTVSLTPDADTFVQLGNGGDDNNGAGTQVVIKDSGGGGTTRLGYLRFLGPLSSALDASLELTVSTLNDGGQAQGNYTVEVFGLNEGVNDAWVEGNNEANVTGPTPPNPIVWNNAPGNNTANNELIGGQVTALGSFTVLGTTAVGTTISFTSPQLLSFLQADTDGIATIIIGREGGNGANNLAFASKENSQFAAAQLNIEVIPEPATATLALLGVAGLIRRRRNVA